MNRKSKNVGRSFRIRIIVGIGLVAFPWLLGGCQEPANPSFRAVSTQARSEPWNFGGVEGQKLTTAHYVIYTTSGNRDLLTRLPDFMESAYSQYCRLSGLLEEPDSRPMPLYVLADRRQWAAMTEQLVGPAAPMYLKISNGGYSYQGMCVLWDLGFYGTFGIAAHEGMHQFLHHRLKNSLPAWVDEGLACLAESCQLEKTQVKFQPERNPIRLADLHRTMGQGLWIPLPRLLGSDAGDFVGEHATDYYSQLWSLLLYIQSQDRYRNGLQAMIRQAAEEKLYHSLGMGDSQPLSRNLVRTIGPPAFERYIDPDLRSFEKTYREYSRRLAK